jgi:hypothetical protein
LTVPASVELSALFDPTLERVGLPLEHPYLEEVYASVLGPSSVIFLRRAGRLLAEHPDGITLDVVDLSRSLGLGARPDANDVGRNSPLRRTMDRLVRFRMASWRDDDRLAAHTKVPALERHRVARLPETVQSAHHSLLTAHLSGLVARAEGRELAPGRSPAPAVAEAEAVKESPVAARLRAFGTKPHDPRTVAR